MTRFVGKTDAGARGGVNQDAMGWDEANYMGFVADGMGGHAAGEVASRLVRETLMETAGSLELEEAVLLAHEKIFTRNEQSEDLGRMGSTVVAVQIYDDLCKAVWVGDSRAYLWRERKLTGMTRDHSAVEELRDTLGLSESELRAHTNRNVVTQSLGMASPIPSVTETPLQLGDWILLCSDGLSSEMRDEEITEVIQSTSSIEQCADALVAAALAKGGHDNVTVVLIEYDGAGKPGRSNRSSDSAIIWISVLAGIGLAMLAAGIWWWLGGAR
jgi:serine/threonine protein phosphatase PrpC